MSAWIDRLRELDAAAAPAPWSPCRANGGVCQCGNVWSVPLDVLVTSGLSCNAKEPYGIFTDEQTSANARLIAEARNLFPLLVEVLAASYSAIERLHVYRLFPEDDPITRAWEALTLARAAVEEQP